MADPTTTQRIHGYCGLCIARCGAVAVVEDGRFTRLEPDPAHPTGQALCAKGRAAPELVYHRERLTYPLRRTRPKGDPDPGWEPIGWDAFCRTQPCETPEGRVRVRARLNENLDPRVVIDFEEPQIGPVARPDLAARFPLIRRARLRKLGSAIRSAEPLRSVRDPPDRGASERVAGRSISQLGRVFINLRASG